MVAVQVKTIQDAVRNKKQRSSPFLTIACSLMFCFHLIPFSYILLFSIQFHLTPFHTIQLCLVPSCIYSIPLNSTLYAFCIPSVPFYLPNHIPIISNILLSHTFPSYTMPSLIIFYSGLSHIISYHLFLCNPDLFHNVTFYHISFPFNFVLPLSNSPHCFKSHSIVFHTVSYKFHLTAFQTI